MFIVQRAIPMITFEGGLMAHHWPKELLIWHCTVHSLGQMVQLITNTCETCMIILSLTALTL